MRATLSILAAFLSVLVTNVSCLICLSCARISQPRHCHRVEECKPDQNCVVEKIIDSFGFAAFNVGCIDKKKCYSNQTATQCSECCEGDLCNSDLCGAQGYPNHTGPICYNCNALPKNRKCQQIDICQVNEVCFLQETEEFGDVMMNSGCETSVLLDEIKTKIPLAQSGPYSVTLKNGKLLMVWCDMTEDGGGWTVFQKRYDGSVDFNQNFTSYQDGFGNIKGEFWLGLENLYKLTVGQKNSLRVDFTYWNGTDFYEQLPGFNIGPGPGYILHVSNRSTSIGTAHSNMEGYNGQKFSTYDMDQDSFSQDNCAAGFDAGFWYNQCIEIPNPNGLYKPGGNMYEMSYIDRYGNMAIQMKVRRNI